MAAEWLPTKITNNKVTAFKIDGNSKRKTNEKIVNWLFVVLLQQLKFPHQMRIDLFQKSHIKKKCWCVIVSDSNWKKND